MSPDPAPEPPPDAPLFDPATWGLTERQAEIAARARDLGRRRFHPRAAEVDRDARFPRENFDDLHASGLLAICVPEEHGGLGADLKTYALAAAEIGRYCGATALTFNMHVCSCLWSGTLADGLEMDPATRATHERRRARHYARIVEAGKIYAQPFSEGGAAAAGGAAFATTAVRTDDGRWRVDGRKIFASLAGAADYYGVLCTETTPGGGGRRRDTLYLAVPAESEGFSVSGEWDPLGMRGTVSRDLLFEGVMVDPEEELMPPGVYHQAATRWPHMFMTLTPAYLGIAQAAVDFTIAYLRGELPGMAPVKRRMYPTKQLAVADMLVELEAAKALWFQVMGEARPDPDRQSRLRAYACQHRVMETAARLTQLAIRTCGGQSMLKRFHLERLYRDARCGSLMLPWTAELCLDRLGREALYLPGESDQ